MKYFTLEASKLHFLLKQEKASCQKNNFYSKVAPIFHNRPRFPKMCNMAGKRNVLNFVLMSNIVIWFKIQMSSKRLRVYLSLLPH